ncbi:DUF2087 domain-containing protein [Gymnodinialimonas ceratoperidinii]|uniref:DUF2087 domain-containing protein n=1 Tax=Gymnodinialimonas ceratoperidinii TaxID=2856823 RepID=A0A8F6TTP3_9RHOB|nr:DUF2087 domain-containing protein [Gymnodinialimonas ceratoperidinii]QXT38757.1 DUF2087 domain-containing protein [Gymnodinialimonas ceratoperidinii]
MTRSPEPLYIADLSLFTKSLRTSLARDSTAEPIGHAKLMDLIAKAAGYRNQQARRAAAPPAPEAPRPSSRVGRALRCFDETGQMTRWPKQTMVQALCLWVMWHHLPPRRELSEPEVNAVLNARHSFGDHALLRRSLVDHGLLARSRDGRVNRRIEQRPPDDARAMIQALSGR